MQTLFYKPLSILPNMVLFGIKLNPVVLYYNWILIWICFELNLILCNLGFESINLSDKHFLYNGTNETQTLR